MCFRYGDRKKWEAIEQLPKETIEKVLPTVGNEDAASRGSFVEA
jgi:hypothetical protein